MPDPREINHGQKCANSPSLCSKKHTSVKKKKLNINHFRSYHTTLVAIKTQNCHTVRRNGIEYSTLPFLITNLQIATDENRKIRNVTAVLLANSHCFLKLTMEENIDDVLVSHTDTSPLRTIQLDYQTPGCSKEYDGDSDLSDEIPSYQLPPKTEKEQAVEEEKQSDAKRKRKAEAEVTSSAEAKITKTEESVRKIKDIWTRRRVPSHSVTTCGQTFRQTNNLKKTFRWLSKKPSRVLFLP